MIREHNKKDPKKIKEKQLAYAKAYQEKKRQEKQEIDGFLSKLASKKKNEILDYLRNEVLPKIEKM